MKKIIGFPLAVLVILGIVWLGASFYSARTTGQYVTSLPELYQQNPSVHLKTVEHHQSAFSSSGKFEIRFPNFAPLSDSGPTGLGFIVEYNISNLLLPDSAGRIKWKMTGDEQSDATLKKLFGQGPTVHGEGTISYTRKRHSTIEVSELLFNDGKNKAQLTPLKGNADWDNNTMILGLKADMLDIRDANLVTKWQGISFAVNITDRLSGQGTYNFKIDKGTSATSTFEGMDLTQLVTLNNDRFTFKTTQTIKQYSFDKYKFSDMDIEFEMRDMDKDSLVTMSNIFRDAKNGTKLTKDERMQIGKALRVMFDKGFSLGFPRIYSKIDGNSEVTGKLNIDVLKLDGSENTAFSSAKRLTSAGELVLKGQGGLDNSQRAGALMFGLAQSTPDGLKSSFSLKDGIVHANGKTFDVSQNLIYVDNVLNSMFNP